MSSRVLVLLVVCACGAGLDGNSGGTSRDANGGGTAQDTSVERFVGAIAMTATVPFGGSPYCTYSVTLENIVLDVTVHPTQGLVTMVIADTMVENIVGSCPYPPAGQARQYFEHLGTPQLPTGDVFRPALTGVAANSPQTEATTVITREKDTRLNATVTWHRTDQTPPLDWTVRTAAGVPILLDRVTCDMGETYCLGGSVDGIEYGCTDGVHLTELKRCPSGCGPITLPPAPHVNETCR